MTVSDSNKVLNGMQVRTVVKVRMVEPDGVAGGLGGIEDLDLQDLIKRIEKLEQDGNSDEGMGQPVGETICTDPTDSGEYECTDVDGGGAS